MAQVQVKKISVDDKSQENAQEEKRARSLERDAGYENHSWPRL